MPAVMSLNADAPRAVLSYPSKMALPRENRLSLRLERERLNKEGQTFFSRHFTLVSAPSSSVGAIHESPASVIPAKAGIHSINTAIPRFGILLSKKTTKLAVDRNLIKRRTSALISENLSDFPVADYLIIPKRSVLDTPHSELLADFLSLLAKLKQ